MLIKKALQVKRKGLSLGANSEIYLWPYNNSTVTKSPESDYPFIKNNYLSGQKKKLPDRSRPTLEGRLRELAVAEVISYALIEKFLRSKKGMQSP
jgi:hypothetical protein